MAWCSHTPFGAADHNLLMNNLWIGKKKRKTIPKVQPNLADTLLSVHGSFWFIPQLLVDEILLFSTFLFSSLLHNCFKGLQSSKDWSYWLGLFIKLFPESFIIKLTTPDGTDQMPFTSADCSVACGEILQKRGMNCKRQMFGVLLALLGWRYQGPLFSTLIFPCSIS